MISHPLGIVTWKPITTAIVDYLDEDCAYKEENKWIRIARIQKEIHLLFEGLFKQRVSDHSQLCVMTLQEFQRWQPPVKTAFDFVEIDSSYGFLKTYPLSQISNLIAKFLQKNPFFQTFDLPLIHFRHLREFRIINPNINIERIEIATSFAEGDNALVYQINCHRIVKIPKKEACISSKEFRDSAQALSRMSRHETINRFDGIAYIVSLQKWGFVFEKIEGKTLDQCVFQLNETQKRTIAIDLLNSAHHFSLYQIRHDDLNGKNIMITKESRAVVIDYERELLRGYDTEYDRLSAPIASLVNSLLPDSKYSFLFRKFRENPFQSYGWGGMAEDLKRFGSA